jgi:hypothetical protein
LESPVPFAAPTVQTLSAEAAFELVLNRAGATSPRRDRVDERVVSDARNRTGKIIASEKDVGGWPVYASGEPPVDTAQDGIPDDWKQARGLSFTDPAIAQTVNGDGYTKLEEYLNSLVPK